MVNTTQIPKSHQSVVTLKNVAANLRMTKGVNTERNSDTEAISTSTIINKNNKIII